MPAAARVGRGQQQKPGWISDMGIRTGDHDIPGLDGLAKGFKDLPGKLGELIEKKHTIMGERHLAWLSRLCPRR